MDMKEQGILPGMESAIGGIETTAQARPPLGSLRFRRPDRSQMRLVPLSLDETIPAGHHVRVLWDVVERLDLSEFSAGLKVCEGEAGRPATDVRLLTALGLYAATQGVGSTRELERLCEYHDSYRWLCGGVRVNYHTLSDFRVDHEEALDGLMTEILAMLMEHKIVSVHRISQDGLRVRASAGKSSFRREERLQSRLEQARAQVTALKAQREAPAGTGRNIRQAAARERAAKERLDRVHKALEALEEEGQGSGAGQPPGQTQPAAGVHDRQRGACDEDVGWRLSSGVQRAGGYGYRLSGDRGGGRHHGRVGPDAE